MSHYVDEKIRILEEAARKKRKREMLLKKTEENLEKILKLVKNTILEKKYEVKILNLKKDIIEGKVKNVYRDSENLLNEIVMDIKINKDNYEIIKSKKENLISRVNTFGKERDLLIEENEKMFFEKINNNLENIKMKIKNSEYSEVLEKEVNMELEELDKEFEKTLDKIELLNRYADSLEISGFDIEDIRYNKDKDKIFVYATKGDKEYNCRINDDFVVNVEFEGYQGDECLKEYEKVVEIARKQYALDSEVIEYKGKPKMNTSTAVNTGLGGNDD